MCRLALLRASEGSFPEEDFKPLSTITALESSNDTIRMNLARVLVTKVLNEGKRLALISKIAEPNGKLLRSVVRGLIQSQGVLTPSLDKYLKVSLSSSHIESWKKFKRANKKKVGWARELIQIQGVLTPSLHTFFKIVLPSSHIKALQKIKREYKKYCEHH